MGALALCALRFSTPTAPPPTVRHRVGASKLSSPTLNTVDTAANDVVISDTNVVNDTAAIDVKLLGNDTCLVTAGVGNPFAFVAEVLGQSKDMYAKKWGYRNYVYLDHRYDKYVQWCSQTEFGKNVSWKHWKRFHIHPVMKFCAMAHAMIERNCTYVFWTDGDGVIVDWDTSLSFDWPGSVKSSSSEPWLLASLAGFPQGGRHVNKYGKHAVGKGLGSRLPANKGAAFCEAADSCTDFYKFSSCLNSGAILMRRSSEAFRIMYGSLSASALSIDHRLKLCSTAHMNPWKFEQCHAGGDQCGMTCSLQMMQKERHEYKHQMPEGISCVSLAAEQKLQEVMSPGWLKGKHLKIQNGRQPSDNALIVNPIGNFKKGNPNNKGKVFAWLMAYYPNMKQFSDGLNESTRRALVGVR
jgi:hypothetical protein